MNKQFQIGFDVSQTGKNKAGCGFFAESLITHLTHVDTANLYHLYPTFGNHFWDSEYNKTFFVKSPHVHRGKSHTSLKDAKNYWENVPSDWMDHLGNVDIIHANNFFCPPKLNNCRLVYTLYDLSFIENPEYTTEHNRIACFNGVYNASLNADYIIAISNYSRNHFLETFPHFPAERISVVYPASRYDSNTLSSQTPSTLKNLIPQKFWLNVGTLEPRKNIIHLLETYAKLKKLHRDTYPLVLAGGKGWLMDNINHIIEKNNLEDSVIMLGYVNNQELQWLYQNCYFFVYPTLFEGFGLPVLEAMTLGAPVITSNISSIPEITHDAALLINPTDENNLLDAMCQAYTQPELGHLLKEKGLLQAKKFSWQTTAKNVLEIYQQLMTIPTTHIGTE